VTIETYQPTSSNFYDIYKSCCFETFIYAAGTQFVRASSYFVVADVPLPNWCASAASLGYCVQGEEGILMPCMCTNSLQCCVRFHKVQLKVAPPSSTVSDKWPGVSEWNAC